MTESLQEKINRMSARMKADREARGEPEHTSSLPLKCWRCQDTGVYSWQDPAIDETIYDPRRVAHLNQKCPACRGGVTNRPLIDQERIDNLFASIQLETFSPSTFSPSEESSQSGRLLLDAFNALHDKRNLWLLGDSGAGKTFLASILAGIASQQKRALLFCRLDALLLDVLNCASNRELSDAARIEAASGVDLLILDDVGSSDLSDWDRAVLTRIADKRAEYGLPTVITSALSRGDLAEGLGVRLAAALSQRAVVLTLQSTQEGVAA